MLTAFGEFCWQVMYCNVLRTGPNLTSILLCEVDMKHLRLALVSALLALSTCSWAALFDNSASATTATATFGVGGDYISLADAASSFTAVAGGINRPWQLEALTSTVETLPSYFGNTFGPDGLLYIKPATGVTD